MLSKTTTKVLFSKIRYSLIEYAFNANNEYLDFAFYENE